MSLNMTLRLDDKEQETLRILSEKLTYSNVKSKAVRYALEFTRQCLANMKYNVNDFSFSIRRDMDKKYKVDADSYKTH